MKVRCPGFHIAYSLKQAPTRKVVVQCKKCGEKFVLTPPQRSAASNPSGAPEPTPKEQTRNESHPDATPRQERPRRRNRKGGAIIKKVGMAAGIVVILEGVLAALAPYWIGMQMEKQYPGHLKKYSRPGSFLMSKESFRRGWFSSEASCSIEFAGKERPLRATLKQRIHHGPIVFEDFPIPSLAAARIQTSIQMTKDVEQELFSDFGSKPPLEIASTAGFNGLTRTTITSPRHNGRTPSGKNAITWEGLECVLISSRDRKEIGIELEIEQLDLDDPMALVSLRKVSFAGSFDTQGRSYPYWLGEWYAEAKVVDAVTLDLSETRFHATEISFHFSEKEVRDALQVNCEIAFSGMQVGDDSLQGGRCEVEFRNINAQALEKLVAVAEKLEASPTPAVGDQVMLQETAPIWEELLRSSPQMEMKHLGIETDHGTIHASALVEFVGDGEFRIDAVEQMLPRLKLDGKVAVPARYVRSSLESYYAKMMMGPSGMRKPRAKKGKTEEMYAQMVDDMRAEVEKKGLLTKNGSTYSVTFRLDNGQFRVNGKGVEEFMRQMMS